VETLDSCGESLESCGASLDSYSKTHGSPVGWFWLYCLSAIWVYTIRTAAMPYVFSDLQAQFQAVGFFAYPVQMLGVCGLPWLLDRLSVVERLAGGKRFFAGLMIGTVLLLGTLPFLSGFVLPMICLYLMILLPSTAMGMALWRGAMLWNPGHAALMVGGTYLLHYVAEFIQYYAFFATGSPVFYLASAFALFGGLPIAMLVIRLRLWEGCAHDLADGQAPSSELALPKAFLAITLATLVLHAFFSTAVNTVWYFDNMDDFHTFGYELFFNLLALGVMGCATWLYHKRRWFVTTLICLLALCFGQGLTLFGIANMPLAVSYNLLTMAAKMPPHMLSLIIPVWYAVAYRKPAWACVGFGLSTMADFLLLLTQLTPAGMSMIPRQGALLLVGLALVGLLVYLYLRYEKIQTDALLRSIKESQEAKRTPEQTLSALGLTPREHEVTRLLLLGDSQRMIAAKLHISGATVGFHTKNLYRKLNIQSRAELFALFVMPQVGA